jgi:hypothetical protein
VQRAEILLRYHTGETVSGIGAALRTNRPRVERCTTKALELSVRSALEDLPGRGRPPALSAEARAWVVNLSCHKPKDLWVTRRNFGRRGCWRTTCRSTAWARAIPACSGFREARYRKFCMPMPFRLIRCTITWNAGTKNLRPK